MSEIKLLPCPFCGGEAYIDKFYESCDGRADRLPKVECKECGVSIGLCYEELWKLDDKFGYTGGYRSNNKELLDGMHQYVAEKWNTRKPMERIIERLKEKAKQRWLVSAERNGYERAIEICKEEGGIE